MKLFGKSKVTPDELQRQASDELDAALARAKPPSEAERTWVLPLPDAPDLRPPRSARAAPRRSPLFDTGPEEPEEAPRPRPATRKPRPTTAAKAPARATAGRKSTSGSKATTAKTANAPRAAKPSTRAKTTT